MATPLSFVDWNNNTNTSRLFYNAGGTSSPITTDNQQKLYELYCELVRTKLIAPTITTTSNIVVTSTCNLYKAGFMNITGNTVLAKTIVQFYNAFKTTSDNSITQPATNAAYLLYSTGFTRTSTTGNIIGNALDAYSFYNKFKDSNGNLTSSTATAAYRLFISFGTIATIAGSTSKQYTISANMLDNAFFMYTAGFTDAAQAKLFFDAFRLITPTTTGSSNSSITQPIANVAYMMYNAGFVKWGGTATHANSFYNIYKPREGNITQSAADDAYKAFSIAMWQCKYINDNATLKITTSANTREAKSNNDYKWFWGLSTTAIVVSLITPIVYTWQMRRV